jgi:hypothetical protein
MLYDNFMPTVLQETGIFMIFNVASSWQAVAGLMILS